MTEFVLIKNELFLFKKTINCLYYNNYFKNFNL